MSVLAVSAPGAHIAHSDCTAERGGARGVAAQLLSAVLRRLCPPRFCNSGLISADIRIHQRTGAPRRMGETERLIESLLSLPSEKLLDFAANFKPTGAAGLQAAA